MPSISRETLWSMSKDQPRPRASTTLSESSAPDSVNLPEGSIDLAFICDTYHHFEFPYRTMESIHRALKPGASVILVDFHRIEGQSSEWVLSHVRAGQEVFAKEISEAGFRQVDEKKNLLKESYFVRFEKSDAPAGK